jgi:hypothetical protein
VSIELARTRSLMLSDGIVNSACWPMIDSKAILASSKVESARPKGLDRARQPDVRGRRALDCAYGLSLA